MNTDLAAHIKDLAISLNRVAAQSLRGPSLTLEVLPQTLLCQSDDPSFYNPEARFEVKKCLKAAEHECRECGEGVCTGCYLACYSCGEPLHDHCRVDHEKKAGHEVDAPVPVRFYEAPEPPTFVERVISIVDGAK